MKQIIIIIILHLFILGNSHGQTTGTEMPKYIPPSPTVAGLEKYGDYPIGYNTGTVNISTDLYSFPLSKELNLDVKLVYHSSGIKVEETSGRVGLGWSLFTGGYISRQVRGKKDEQIGSGFYHFIQKRKGFKFSDMNYESYGKSTADSIAKGWLDPSPDLFSLNILGRSYKFFLGNDGEFHTIPYSNIKFQKHPLIANTSDTWEVIDEFGNRYNFGLPEGISSGNLKEERILSWWLLSIVSPEGNTLVSFEYKTSNSAYASVSRYVQTFYVDISDDPYGILGKNYVKETSSDAQPPYESWDLSRINLPGKGYITFEANTDRSDQSWKLINEVRHYDLNNALINKYSLSYSDTYLTNMYLTQILKIGSDGTTIKYRTFSYYPEHPGSNSKAQDFWGYYNGKKSNKSLYPYESLLFRENYVWADRYPTQDAVAGTIKEIVYPSGGKTLFEFENNKIDGTIVEVIPELKEFTLTHTQNDFGEVSSTSFTTVEHKGALEIDMSIHPVGLYSVDIKLIQIIGDKTQQVMQFNDASVISTDFEKKGTNPDGTLRYLYKNLNYNFKDGTYKWVTTITDNDGRPNRPKPYPITISNKYYTKEPKSVTHENIVGGLRIAQISNYDKDGKLLGKTRYSYLKKDGKCSGIGAPRPEFLQKYVITEDICPLVSIDPSHPCTLPQYLNLQLYKIGETDLNNYTGSPVQYTFVVEEKIGYGAGSIKTEYEYMAREFRRNQLPHLGFAYTPYSLNDYEEGLLLCKTDYEFKNNAYVPIRKESNTYTIKNIGTDIPAFTAISLEKYYMQPDLSINKDLGYTQKYIIGSYDFKSAKVYLASKKLEETTSVGTITNTYNYYYNNPSYHQLSSSTHIGSNGLVNETLSKYSYDYSTDVSKDMVIKNIISPPFSIVRKVNGEQMNMVQSTYGYFNTTPIIELQKIEQTSKILENPRVLQYHNYDSYGNPLYITKDDVTKIIYLWSYNGQYPIAEIKNATYDQVKTALGVTPESLSSAASPNSTLINGLRTNSNLSQALITTYTYKPLVGILTMTDPCEVTTHYEYDSFGRLKASYVQEKGSSVKKLLQSYDYHYQNQ